MKFFFVLLFLYSLTVNSQTIYKKVESGFEKKEVTISLTKEKVYLSFIPVETVVKDVGISVANYELARFRKGFSKAINKFEEWKKVAIENSITKFRKEVSINDDFGFDGHFYYGSQWYFDRRIKVTYTFVVSTNEQGVVSYYMTMVIGKMSASTNQFITSKGGLMMFFDVEKMKTYLSYLSDESIKEFRDSENTKDNLFKDGDSEAVEDEKKESLFKD